MKDEYFKLHQWDMKTGLPETSTLEKLDLLDIVESIIPFAQKSKGEKE
jgi:aldehyde:ferredoxin oxidoreductase